MSVTTVAAYYVTKSLLLVMVFIPSFSDGEIGLVKVPDKLTKIELPIGLWEISGARGVQEFIGEPHVVGPGEPSSRGIAVRVDNGGRVVGTPIIADPEFYHDPNGLRIMLCEHCEEGDVWDGNYFVRPSHGF